jgi:hypothetical protein
MENLNKVSAKPTRGRPSLKDKEEAPAVEVEPIVTSDALAPSTEQAGEYTAEIIRDYYGQVDPFYLSKKNPEYEYRFLRDEAKNLSIKTGNLLLQKGGWQLCPKEHLRRLGIKDMELSPDGFLRRGDTVLAFMPKKLYEEKFRKKVADANEPVSAVKRLVRDGDPNTGGKELHDSMKGIQTAKQLGMSS